SPCGRDDGGGTWFALLECAAAVRKGDQVEKCRRVTNGGDGFVSLRKRSAVIPALAWAATFAEVLLGLALVLGFFTPVAALLSGLMLLLFALTMTFALGVKAPLDFSVFSASAGALLLAAYGKYPLSIDALRRRDLRLLGGSYARPELPRGDADDAVEVMRELALIRKPGVRGDLRQGQFASGLQELLGPLDASGDDVLVRWQSGGPLELPGEVVGTQTGDHGHLLQGRAGVEVFLDVLDDGAEPCSRERAGPPVRGLAGCQDVPEQVDGQDVGQGLGSQRSAGATGRQFGVYRRHRGPQMREVQAVQWRQRQPRRVEAERPGGDP